MTRRARIWWLVEVITASTRRAMEPDLSTEETLRLLGSGHRGYGITCEQIADRFGISRSQAWRDKQDAEAVAGLVWGGGCMCHLKRQCPRDRPNRQQTLERADYAEMAKHSQYTALAMAQTDSRERTPVPSELGRLIRAGRLRLGVTQTHLAELVGIPQPYLSQLENGKRCPSWSVADALAQHLFPDRQAAEQLVAWAVVGRGRDWSGPEPVIIDGLEVRRVRDIPRQSAKRP